MEAQVASDGIQMLTELRLGQNEPEDGRHDDVTKTILASTE
jgi:hypothetical protein